MSIEIKKVQCPYCGASFEATGLTESVACPYCDQKVIINNENEIIYREIKDAEIKKTDAEYQLELKRLEIAEKERLAQEKKHKIALIVSILSGIAGIAFMAVGLSMKELEDLASVGMACLAITAWVGLFSLLPKQNNNSNQNNNSERHQ